VEYGCGSMGSVIIGSVGVWRWRAARFHQWRSGGARPFGVVTTLFKQARLQPARSLAFACGPEIMMRFVARDLETRGLARENIYLSMERNMKCAVGFCGHCQYSPHFICEDGPIFSYERRERILVWLDMTSGLRRDELAGLRWEDISFQDLEIMAQRSVVDQVVGPVKTEASKRPIPIDPAIAEDLLAWYRTTKYNRPEDYLFATDSPRTGKKRGKQPVWLSRIMQYYIQPAAKRVGITFTRRR